MDDYMELASLIRTVYEYQEELSECREKILKAQSRITEIKHNTDGLIEYINRIEFNLYGKSVFGKEHVAKRTAELEADLVYEMHESGSGYHKGIVDAVVDLKPGTMDVDKLSAALDAMRFGMEQDELDAIAADMNAEQTAEHSADNSSADSGTLDKSKPWLDPKFPYGA